MGELPACWANVFQGRGETGEGVGEGAVAERRASGGKGQVRSATAELWQLAAPNIS